MNQSTPSITRYVNFTTIEYDIVLTNARDQFHLNVREAFSGSVRQIIIEWYRMRNLLHTLPHEQKMEFVKIRNSTPLIVANVDVDLEHSGRKVEFNTLEYL